MRFQIGSNVSISAATFVMVRRLSILIRQHDPVSEKRHVSSIMYNHLIYIDDDPIVVSRYGAY